MTDDKRFLTVRELADLAGISPSALRAWERRFSIFSPERTQGGHRLYTLEDLKVLWFVRRQQNLGRDLKEIASIGRDKLLAESLHFFETQGESQSKTERSQAEAIIEALEQQNLATAAQLMEALWMVSPRPSEFAAQILHLFSMVAEGRRAHRISLIAEATAHASLRYLMLRSIRDAAQLSAPSALVVSLTGARNGFGTLWAALHLREWGYSIITVENDISLDVLHEFMIEAAPPLLLLGIPPTPADEWVPVCNRIAMMVAPHALTLITAADLPHPFAHTFSEESLRFFHPLLPENLIGASEIAHARLSDPRPPAQILLEWLRKSTQSRTAPEP